MTEDDEQVRSQLRVLSRRTPAATGWAAADVVRRTVRVRRRWRFVGGIGAVVLVAAGLALTTRGTSRQDTSPLAHAPGVHMPGAHVPGVHTAARIGSAVQLVSDATPLAKRDAAATAAVAAAEQRLGIRLLQTVNGPGNVSVSPASLYLALGMLQNGAGGRTEQEISDALQAGTLGTAKQNAGLAGLTDELAAAAQRADITLESANSLWQQRGFPVRRQFLADLATYYRAGVWQADFFHHNTEALAAIDKWTSRHTHGKIDKLFDQLDPTTVLVIANAIYFHAAWAIPFDGHVTTDGTFTTTAGERVAAKFMIGGPGLLSAAGSGYQAIELPYEGDRFAALAVMPTSGSLADFVATMAPAKIASIAGSLQPGSTQIALPRFTTTSKVDMVPVLASLGMHDAFTPAADLSGLSPGCGCRVDQILQRVYLGVGEKGTTAAAVTGISIIPVSTGGGLPAIRFDHPFLFLIRDTQTGAILFASKIEDPTAS